MATTITKAGALNVAPLLSTAGGRIVWATFSTATGNALFDVRDVKADKMVILVAAHTTLPQRFWIGTSDSRATGTSRGKPYSAGKLGRVLVTVPASTKTSATAPESFYTFATGSALRGSICMIGPLETARHKDTQGFIRVCRGRTLAGGGSHSTTPYKIAAILIP